MKFVLENIKENPVNTMRSVGYAPHRDSFVRLLGRNKFPRFHAYLKKVNNRLEISLHLDQKGACYDNATAHSGDYDGEILNTEQQRIINILN